MVKKWMKFVDKVIKSGDRRDLADILEDIIFGNNFEDYDIVPYQGYKNQFRVRIGNYRIIFEKNKQSNKIIKINKRGDIY